MSNEIGLREARAQLGPIANRAEIAGEITYLTRNGKRIAAIVPLDRIKEPVMPRNVISTNAHVDVTDEYAERVRAILSREWFPERETFTREDGQKTYYTRVVQYNLGEGPRWAVEDFDPASWEVEEFTEQDAAEERYEELVRARAENTGFDEDGNPIPFTETDVEGVPAADD